MRKIYWFLWICCMAAVVSACSNDEDEPGTVIPGGGNGSIGELPGGDDIWPENVRRVRRIARIYESGLPEDFINFEYHGKVVKGLGYEDASYWDFKFNLTIGTSAVEIFSGEDSGTACLELQDGRIKEGVCNIVSPYDVGRDSCYCTYTDGYLKRMVRKNFYRIRDYESDLHNQVAVTDYQYDFTFASGNLQSKEKNGKQTGKYTYSKEIRNDANIDLWVFLDECMRNSGLSSGFWNDHVCLGMFGFLGNRSKSLPTGAVVDTEYDGTLEWSISYEVDGEGYPTRIEMKEKNSGEVETFGIYY